MDDLPIKNDSGPISKCPPVHFSRLRIIKNATVLCLVFFMTFTAYDCLSMLQSTLNHEDGIGVICQSIVYAGFCISSLLLPKYVTKKFGCKVTLVISMCLYLPYIASNLYPHWAFMVPAATVNGLVASLLWGSQCIYLNEIAVMYASLKSSKNYDKNTEKEDFKVKDANKPYDEPVHNSINHDYDCNIQKTTQGISRNDNLNCSTSDQNQTSFRSDCSKGDDSKVLPSKSDTTMVSRKKVESITARFFGIFGMAYLSTHMWSNIMSYFILQKDALHSNGTLNASCICGAQFCNVESDCFIKNLQEPSLENREFLTGLCLSLGVISILILIALLDPLNDQNREVKFSLELVFATCKQLKKKNQALLVPLSFYVGMIQGFYTGDFNVSFVGCAWGTYHVGLVSGCYGAACGIASLSGSLVTKIGRLPIFIMAALMNAVAQILLLTWVPNADNPNMFFLISALWGVSVGVLWSQLKAMCGFLFKKDEEASFAAYHLWYSLGFCVAFAYSNHLCTYVKIYILMSVLIVGMISYLYVEISLRYRIK